MRLTPVVPAIIYILCSACGGAAIALALVSLTFFQDDDLINRNLGTLSSALVAIPFIGLVGVRIYHSRHRQKE